METTFPIVRSTENIKNFSTKRKFSPRVERKLWFYHYKSKFRPHDNQIPISCSESRFRVVVCGRRWGKSMLGAAEVNERMTIPKKMIWIVAPTYDLSDKVFRLVYQYVIRSGMPTNKKSESKRFITFPWGTEVRAKSADNPDSLVGEGVDFALVDEAAKIKKSVWQQYLRPTLSDKKGDAMLITTPQGYNWVWDMYQFGKSKKYKNWDSWQFPTWTNPYIDPEEIEEARAELDPEVFAQEYGADFQTFAGQVFKAYSPEIHEPDEMWVDRGKIYIKFRGADATFASIKFVARGIDFGFNNPFCCLWCIMDTEDRFYFIDEHYGAGMGLDTHARAIKKRDMHINATYADHDSQDRFEIAQKGIITVPAVKDVTPGLRAINSKLKIKHGLPSIFVGPKCINLRRQIPKLKYKESTKTSDANHEKPIEIDDHATDAARYIIFSYLTSRGLTSIFLTNNHSVGKFLETRPHEQIVKEFEQLRQNGGKQSDFRIRV